MIRSPDSMVAGNVIQVSITVRPEASNVLGAIHVWRKGGEFGHADELMKFCPAPGCLGLFQDSFHLTGADADLVDQNEHISAWPAVIRAQYETWYTMKVACDECGLVSVRQELPDTYGFNMPTARIAERMSRFFHKLGGDADAYLVRTTTCGKFHEARAELMSPMCKGGTYQGLLDAARAREGAFYPLKQIVRDTASGGSLVKRFKAFLEA
jgi:hypothetical protein